VQQPVDAVEVVLLAVAEALLLEAGSDPRPQEQFVEWPSEVVFRAARDAVDHALHVVQRGDHEYGDVLPRLAGLEAVQHGEAVHPRHEDVEEDQVERGVLEFAQRLLSAGSHRDEVPQLAEEQLEQFAVGAVVIDDEEASALRRR